MSSSECIMGGSDVQNWWLALSQIFFSYFTRDIAVLTPIRPDTSINFLTADQ